MSIEELVSEFRISLEALDRVQAQEVFERGLQYDTPINVVESLIVPALGQIGDAWHLGSVSLAQVYMAGRYCEDMVEKVLPPKSPERKGSPRQAIAVLQDYHMLGKRIVYSVLRASGFEPLDYGSMTADALVERAIADGVRILLISALMLPSALKVREVRDSFDQKGYPIHIIVGGAPFSFDQRLWKEVGADAMGKNATEAVEMLKVLMKEGL